MPRIAFTVILSLLLTGAIRLPAQEKTAGQAGTVRTDVNLVSVYFTVRDGKSRLIPNLKQSDFQVFEDGKEQAIGFFALHTDVPLNIGVLLDTSTAMTPLL